MQLTLETLHSIDEKLAHFLSNFETTFQSELETKNENQKQDLFWEALVEAIPEIKPQTLQNLKNICGTLIGKAPGFSSFLRELRAKVTPEFDRQVRLSEEKDGFDREFGTITAPIIGQFDLGSQVSFDRWEKSVRYVPSPAKIVSQVLDQLYHYTRSYEDYTFIDIGAGLGRNLLLASHYPFQKVIGVEIATELAEVAKQNIEIYHSSQQRCYHLEMACVDALEFQFPTGNLVLYFYWPFPEEVSRKFVERLENRLSQQHDHVVLVFLNGVFSAIEESSYFAEESTYKTTDLTGLNALEYTVDIYSNQKELERRQLQAQKYWSSKLKGYESWFSNQKVKKGGGELIKAKTPFSKALSDLLQSTAKQKNFNCYKLLLSALTISLGRWDKKPQLLLASPALHLADETESGLVYIESNPDWRGSGRNLLRNLHTELETVLAHRPLDTSSSLAQQANSTEGELFFPSISFGYSALQEVEDTLRSARLSYWIQKQGEDFTLHLFAVQGAFSMETLDEMAADYLNVIEQLCSDLDQPITDYPDRAAPAWTAILSEFIPTASPQESPVTVYPLSPQQKRIFILQHFDEESTSYNMPFLYPVMATTVLKHEQLEQVFLQLLERHEILRTSFYFHGGQPVQQVSDTIDFQLERYRDMEENEALECFVRPFDLAKAPLLRAGILQNADSTYLLFDVHHIVFDGWSQQILLQEIRSLLENQMLPDLPIQYKDYVIWLSAPSQRLRLKAQQQFWLHTFEEAPPLLELPTDFERPEVQQFDGASVSFALSNREVKILRRICEERKSTLYVVLLALWKILLAKWTNQFDLVVGTPVAGRNHPDLEHLVGMFVNTLPLRTRPTGEKTFTAFLSEVRHTFIAALDHQDYPFEELVDRVWDSKLKNRNPIFDTMFGFVDKSQLDGFYERISEDLHFNQEIGETKFDLHLTATDYEDEIGFELSYSTSLFSQDGIKKLIAYFRKLIAELDQYEDRQLSDINILSEQEKERLICEYNNTALPFDHAPNFIDLIEEQAKLNPEKIAVRWEEENWTYQEINQQANRLAHYLSHQGVKPGVRVAVCLERSTELIISLLGILKAGGAYVPIDPNYPQERIKYIFDDAQAAFAIMGTRSPLLADYGEKNTLILWEVLKEQLPYRPTANLGLRLDPEDLAYIIYTSGSTGKPKGVMIGQANVQAFIQWCLAEFRDSSFEWVYAVTSICFDLSIFEIFFTLSAGKSIRLLENGLQIKDYLGKEAQVLINTVPSVIQNLQEANVSWESVSLINMAGEPIPEQVKDRLDLTRIEVRNLYGPSEDTTYSTFFRLQKDQPVLIGKPIGNTQVYLLDQDMNLRPSGLVGELCLSGAGVAQGYWNRPELTADKFLDNPFNPAGAKLYRTGDLARWLPDGNLAFLGRNDHQVKIRGYRIELGEIERTLLDMEGIRRAVVVARQTKETGESLIAAYVLGKELEVEQIRSHLQSCLPAYMIPTVILIIDALPLTPNGKIDKKALPDPRFTANQEQVFMAPQTSTERTLVSIWEDLLKVEPIGVWHSFFELGGQSLIATQMIAAVKERLQCSITIREIFRHPKIQQLAAAIDRAESVVPTFSRNKQTRPDQIPLSYAQERMWVIDSLEGSTQYHIPIVLEFSSAVNTKAWKQAFETLIERHEILRTVYKREEDQLFQQILPPGQWKWTEKECQEEQWSAFIAQEVRQAFDLANDHPIRATWLQLSPEKETLVIVLHHIAVDEWSLSILTTELEQLYTAYDTGTQPNLLSLSRQYADYAIWQRTYLNEERLRGPLQYWKEKLAGIKPLSFPTDYPRTAHGSINGETVSFLLDRNACRKLKKLAKELDVTPFILFLTSLKVLLSRYCGQGDICVGSPVTNRGQQELQDMVGLFLNTIALRTQLDRQDTFLAALTKVKENVLDAFAYQQVPFEKVLEVIDVGRDLSQHPIFQILFVWHESVRQKDMELTTPAFSKHEIDTKQVKFDLSFHLEENEGDLELSIEYCIDLFSAATIRQLARHFNQLLIEMATDPQVVISEVNLLATEEKEQLLTKGSQVADFDPLEATAIDLFEKQAAKTPDQIAMVFENCSWTYQELNQRANQLARYIEASADIKAGDAIAVMMDRSDWYAVAMISILKLGAVYVPIDRSLPVSRLNYMIEDCSAEVILVDRDQDIAIDTKDARTLVLASEEGLDQEAQYNLELNIAEDATAFVIYTSGSTGQPKGVEQTHKMLYNLIQWDRTASGLLHGQKHLQFSAFSFDSSLHDIFYALTTGGEVHILSESCRRDLRLVKAYIITQGIGTLSMPYAALKPLFGLGTPEDFEGHQLQEIISTGEQLYINGGLRAFLEANPTVRIFNLYGPSETHVVTAKQYAFAEGEVPVKSTIGEPIANTSLFILDDRRQLVPIGVPGEVYIGGANLAKGYIGKDRLTQERFIADPFNPGAKLYKSGDLARWLHTGEIEYLGRRDDQVKVRGFRIELGEVEAVLQKAPFVNQCVVLVKKDAQHNKRLVAYLAVQAGYTDTQLRGFMATQLPDHLIPAMVVEMEAFPLNHNGKVDKRRLPEPHLQAYDKRTYIAPGNPTEEELAQIWQSVLGVEKMGVLDDFFRLGGHSINAVQVAAKAAKSFGVELPLRTFFQHRNIRELAKVVDQSKASYTPIPAAPQRAHYPTTSAQKRLFLIQELSPHSTAYNIPQVHDWDASITEERLRIAFEALVDRHASLRTVFAFKDGELVQTIYNELNFEIRAFAEDISVEAALSSFVKPFDLQQGPLFRLALWKTSNKTRLLFDIHHIITDEISDLILQEDLFALLNGQMLKKVAVQIHDLAYWQSLSPQLAQLQLQQAYWLSLFADTPPLLHLPLDYPRAKLPNFNGSSVCFDLTADQAHKINQLAVEAGTSIYVVLLACWGTFLSKLSRSEDIVVGAIVNGRNHPDLETTVGMLVKTLPLRLQPKPFLTFLDFLKQIDAAFFAAIANQDFSLEDLVEQVWDPSILGRNPLFDTTLSFFDKRDKFTASPISTEGIVHGISHEHAKFDLSLTAVQHHGHIHLELNYKTSLFRRATAEMLLAKLIHLIENICLDPEHSIDQYSIIPPLEKQKLLKDFQGKSLPHDPSTHLLSLVEKSGKLAASRTALVTAAHSYSYREIDKLSNQLANYLAEKLDGASGQLIGIKLERTEWLIVAILGVLKSGNAYVPLSVTDPIKRIKFIVEDSQCQLLLNAAMIEKFKAERSRLSDAWTSSQVSGDDLAYVIYTSGSTGQPKGCLITHRNVVNLIVAQIDAFDFREDEKVLLLSNSAFDASVEQIFLALCTGAQLHLLEESSLLNPKAISTYIEEQQITHIHTVPSFLATFTIKKYRALRRVIAGGEKCPPNLAMAWAKHHQFYNEYGPTETTVTCAEWKFDGATYDDSSIPLGRPLANVEIYVLNDQLQLLPIGAKGEICIGGAGLGLGYLNRPDLTKDKFVEHPFQEGEKIYRTGDIGSWGADGQLRFVGRKDEQVKLRGFRIELGEIEHTILQLDRIEQAVALVKADNIWVFLQSKHEIDLPEIKTEVSTCLPSYMLPHKIIQLDELPKTSSGKVDKKALALRDNLQSEAQSQKQSARTQLEKELLILWEDLLLLDGIGMQENFFELGGHSILSMKLIAAVQERFGLRIGIKDILLHPTIALLARFIEDGRVDTSLLVPLNRHTPQQAMVIAVPPILGTSNVFWPLAQLLEERQINCFGLQYQGYDQEVEFDPGIEAMAQRFFTEIRGQVDDRSTPITLLGYSMGGAIGFELIGLLEQEYSDCRLVIIDRGVSYKHGVYGYLDKHLSRSEQLGELERLHLGKGTSKYTPEKLSRIRKLLIHNHQILQTYQPRQKINSPLLAIEAELEKSKCRMKAWRKYTKDTFEHHYLISDHFSVLSKEVVPQVLELLVNFVHKN